MAPKARTLIAVPFLATALLLSSCGGSDNSNSSTPAPPPAPPAPPSASASPAPTAVPSSTADEAVLKRIVLREADLEGSGFDASGAGITAESDGTSLGVATFDYCGGDFPSEGQRTGRLFVSAEGTIGSKETGLASQAVEYTDPGAAEQAVQQLKTAIEGCDNGAHPTSLNEGKPLTFKPGERQADIPNLPKPNYLVVTQLSDDAGNTRYLAQLILQNGKYVVINYLLSNEQVDRQSGVTLGFVTVRAAQRLETTG